MQAGRSGSEFRRTPWRKADKNGRALTNVRAAEAGSADARVDAAGSRFAWLASQARLDPDMNPLTTGARARAIRLICSLLAAFGASLILTAVTSARARVSDIDFQVFYESAQAWTAARDLYATAREYPNLNPPHFVVAFAPLTRWPEHTAVLILTIVNLAGFLAVGVLIWRELRLPRTFTAITIAVAAAGFCVGLLVGLEEGHPIGLLALCSTGAWAAHRRDRHALAGVLAGVLISLKPFFACLLIAALVRRHWRLVAMAISIAAALTSAGALLAGPHSMARWLETGRHVTWFHHPMNASLAGLFARAGWDWPSWTAAVALLLAVTGLALRRSSSLDKEWLAAGLASLLLSPLGWVYYVPLLAGPLAAVARHRPRVLAAGAGLVWPVPALMTVTSPEGLAAVTICSITTWSLLAMWAATLHALNDDRVHVPV